MNKKIIEISIENAISKLIYDQRQIANIYFTNNDKLAPLDAYQVEFPRIEIIVEGKMEMLWADRNGKLVQKTLLNNDLLYIVPSSWHKPIRTTPVTTLSLLFGKQQIGISLLHWDGEQFIPKGQSNTPRRGPRIGTFILQALSELAWHHQPSQHNLTSHFLIQSLLSNTLDLLTVEVETASKTTSLFEAVRQYIDTHFRENLTRNFLANMFYVSPNYLSHLFQREGKIGLNEYLIQIRLEYAKSLLKRYDLNVQDIAFASGFKDSNYFCRVFRKKTERSPTEYRRQYHSKLLER